MRAAFFSFALLATPAIALDGVPGAFVPGFNDGAPLVGSAAGFPSGQLFGVWRERGTPVGESRYWMAGQSLSGTGASTVVQTLTLEDPGGAPPGWLIEPVQVLKSASEAIYGLNATAGAVTVGTNSRRDDGGFDASLRKYHKSGSDVWEAVAEVLLAPGGEATDLVFGGESAETKLGDRDLRYYVPVVSGSGACADLSFRQINLQRPAGGEWSFESKGTLTGTLFSTCHLKYWKGAAGQGDVVFGGRCRPTPNAPEAACLYRVRPANIGSSMSFDPDFGGGDGQAIIRTSDGTDLRYFNHVVDPDHNRVVVALGVGSPQAGFKPGLIALTLRGDFDATFGQGGAVEIPTTGLSSSVRGLGLGFGVGYQATGETSFAGGVKPYWFSLDYAGKADYREYDIPEAPNAVFLDHERGPLGMLTVVGTSFRSYPDTSSLQPVVARLGGPTRAVETREYYHTGFRHHFFTSIPAEIEKLEAGGYSGWVPTGDRFYTYAIGTPGTRDLFRFFSNFGDKSSHFSTLDAAEAEKLAAGSDWLFEGVAGAVRPLGANGECPADASPGYRSYNNGVTGAPNHWMGLRVGFQYSLVKDLGYVPEGYGSQGRFFCAER